MRSFSFALFLAILALAANRASSQAYVTENQSHHIYVDASNGSDGNSGAQNSPFKTVQAAINKANDLNRQGIGVKIIVGAGVYRESVGIYGYNQTGATLTVQAASTGTATISGSDVLKGWNQENATVYSHSWNYNFGTCAVPSGWPSNFANVARRTEMIFINNVPLTQVMTYADLRPGTFYVNEGSNVIHVAPPTYMDINSATVEAAVRKQTLNVGNRTNVVLRGLVFKHAANCINTSSANVYASSNVLIDSVQALWNNWGGLNVNASTGVTVKNSIASYNGGVGFQAGQDQKVLYSFNETDYNNWRGAMGALYDWGMGGAKLMLMRNTTVQDHFSYRNQAQGLWFDTDNKNITIKSSTLSHNVMAALQIERNEGPMVLENSHLCSSGIGANILTSEGLTIQNNTFYNNSGTGSGQAEIFIAGQPGGKWITDWQTGQSYDLFTKNLVLSGNTFENASSGQNVFGTYLSGADWSDFANSLNASNNKWYDPTTSSSFKIVNGKVVTLSGWRSATGTDYSSSWGKPATSPAGACSVPTPSFNDFAVDLDKEKYTMSAGKAVVKVRLNSYGYGTVKLQAKGMPSNVGASFSQQSLVSGVVTLTVSANKYAANQNVPITLWAVAGSRVHSVTVYVHVIPA